MKRFLCCCLALVMVFAVLLPSAALADDADDDYYYILPFWTWWWGHETMEEFLEWHIERYGMDPDPETPFWQDWGSGSLEDFLFWSELDLEDYLVLEETYKSIRAEYALRFIRAVEELGGIPGIINVMYNGEFIKFADAVPELTGDTTFVPAKPFFEAMGAKVGFDNESRSVIAEFDGMIVRLVIGQDTIQVTENGLDTEFCIDEAPYITGNVSYIPVRSVSEALGLQVFWDSNHRSVVALDMKKIDAELDKNFKILNRLSGMPLSMMPADLDIYKTTINMLATITMFNSLDGDVTENLEANILLHSDGQNFSMTCKINLSGLINLMLADDPYYADDDSEYSDLSSLLDALNDTGVEIIINYDDDMMYVKAPVLSEFIPELPKDAWIAIEGISGYLEDFVFDSILQEINFSSLGFGQSISELAFSEVSWSYRYRDQVYLYGELMNAAEYYTSLFGDDRFTTNGGDLNLSLTLNDLDAAGEKYRRYLNYSRFSLELTVNSSDDEITGITCELLYREGYFNYQMQTSLELVLNQNGMYISYEMHERNHSVMSLEIDIKTTGSNEPVPKAPPDGDTVISAEDFEEIFMYEIIGDIQPLTLDTAE